MRVIINVTKRLHFAIIQRAIIGNFNLGPYFFWDKLILGVHAMTDIVNLTDSNVKILMNVLKVLTNVTISMELARI